MNKTVMSPDFLEGSDIAFCPQDYKRHPLLYTVLRLGHVIGGKRFGFTRHSLDSFALLYLLNSTASLSVENETISVKKGDLLFLDQSQLHDFHSTCDRIEFDFVYFSGPNVKNFQLAFLQKHGLVFDQYDPSLFRHTVAELASQMKDKTDTAYRTSSYVYAVLTDLLRYCEQDVTDAFDISVAVEYIKSNYTKEFNLDALAALCCMNKYDFIKQFRARTDMTPKQYYLEQRARISRNLLKSTDLSVREIAERVGFADTKGLVALFRQTMNMTPSEFRKGNYEEFFERKRRLQAQDEAALTVINDKRRSEKKKR